MADTGLKEKEKQTGTPEDGLADAHKIACAATPPAAAGTETKPAVGAPVEPGTGQVDALAVTPPGPQVASVPGGAGSVAASVVAAYAPAVPASELRFKLLLSAAPERVWKALTEPKDLVRWFCRSAAVDAKSGGKFAVGWAEGQATDWTVSEASAPKTLVLDLPEKVTFTLAADGGKTLLELKVTPGPDPMPPVKEQVLWAVHLMYLRGFLDFNVDLREADLSRKWRDDFVNGSEA